MTTVKITVRLKNALKKGQVKDFSICSLQFVVSLTEFDANWDETLNK